MKLFLPTKLCVLFAAANAAVVLADLPPRANADTTITAGERLLNVENGKSRGLKKRDKKSNKKSKKNKGVKTPSADPTTPTTPTTDTPTPVPKLSVAQRLSKLSDAVAFGDSLTDTGNLELQFPCNLAATYPDLYCGARWSNGLLFAEYLLDLIGLPAMTNSLTLTEGGDLTLSGGTNFAVASSTAGDDEYSNDFKSQVSTYTGYLQTFKSSTIDPKTLHFIHFGANDIAQIVLAFSDAASVATAIVQVVADFITNIETLIQLGACSFLIVGVPDFGKVPLAALFPDLATSISLNLESAFLQALQTVELTNVSPSCLGLEYVSFIEEINTMTASEEFTSAITDQTNSCNDRYVQDCVFDDLTISLGLGPGTPHPTREAKCNYKVPLTAEKDLDQECLGFLFFDELHTSTKANELFAIQLFSGFSTTAN